MAKVDTIELIIDGITYKYNINVGKSGIFNCKIDWKIKKKLGIEKIDIASKTLQDLKGKILIPYHAYLESNKVEEIFISIIYAANGNFSATKDIRSPFYSQDFIADGDRLVFDFDVYMKVSHSTGAEYWYKTRKGQGCVNYNEGDLNDPNTWYKWKSTYDVKGVLIPYSDKAYKTLLRARNGIKDISEILFNLLNQDSKIIESILLGGNLVLK
ncbi:hypothetical protein R5O20_02780 [Tenacibaculum maritimum]|uniref:hypothetical protein n=1 Tax=Tenacibaculum maritimum TaxID=107401 RepID=UPI00388FFE87